MFKRKERTWKVGELARETGLTVRTLHYYEEIGLFTPSRRTASDHRIYTEQDLVRLQQIVALRQFGMSLEDISLALDDVSSAMPTLLQHQLDSIWEQQEHLHRLAEELETLVAALHSGIPLPAEHVLEAIRLTTVIDRYFTREQRELMRSRKALIGRETFILLRAQWLQLTNEIQEALRDNVDPRSPQAAEFARRWRDMMNFVTGGNEELNQALQNMHEQEADACERIGLSAQTIEWLSLAHRHHQQQQQQQQQQAVAQNS